jgi:hypothetical protein
MTDIAKMDIFFIVTTGTVLILGVLLVVLILRILRIMKNVEHISENVSHESDAIREDLVELRGQIRENGFRVKTWRALARTIKNRFAPKKREK